MKGTTERQKKGKSYVNKDIMVQDNRTNMAIGNEEVRKFKKYKRANCKGTSFDVEIDKKALSIETVWQAT